MDEHPLETALTILLDELVERFESAFERALRKVLDGSVSLGPSRDTRDAVRVTEPALGQTTTGWQKIDRTSFKSGRVTRTIYAGSPVKVKGLGRGGGIGSGYKVTGLEQRGDDVNVHVRKGRDQERTVKLDRIIYVIPQKPVSPEFKDKP